MCCVITHVLMNKCHCFTKSCSPVLSFISLLIYISQSCLSLLQSNIIPVFTFMNILTVNISKSSYHSLNVCVFFLLSTLRRGTPLQGYTMHLNATACVVSSVFCFPLSVYFTVGNKHILFYSFILRNT